MPRSLYCHRSFPRWHISRKVSASALCSDAVRPIPVALLRSLSCTSAGLCVVAVRPLCGHFTLCFVAVRPTFAGPIPLGIVAFRLFCAPLVRTGSAAALCIDAVRPVSGALLRSLHRRRSPPLWTVGAYSFCLRSLCCHRSSLGGGMLQRRLTSNI